MTEEQNAKKKISNQRYVDRNKEKINERNREYYKKNKTKISKQQKEYAEKNKDKKRAYKKLYDIDNKDKLKQYFVDNKKVLKEKRKVYIENNREKIRNYNTTYKRIRKESDPTYALATKLRSMLVKVFKQNGYKKNTKTCQILGCSFEEFKIHIEAKFETWMNWENYGNPKDGILEPNKTWDIDHIIPLATATNESDIFTLNHYSNLQPLCSYYNRNIKRDIL